MFSAGNSSAGNISRLILFVFSDIHYMQSTFGQIEFEE
jgi:hypothetical protein